VSYVTCITIIDTIILHIHTNDAYISVLVSATLYASVGGAVSGDWGGSVHTALLLLVLACPCAVVIAAPIPAVCAIASAGMTNICVYVCVFMSIIVY
jgi:cation transport ATPase